MYFQFSSHEYDSCQDIYSLLRFTPELWSFLKVSLFDSQASMLIESLGPCEHKLYGSLTTSSIYVGVVNFIPLL